MALNAAVVSRGKGDNDGLGREKNSAVGHKGKGCGICGKFYRRKDWE